VNATPEMVGLQEPPKVGPTVRIWDVIPDAHPVESNMVMRNSVPVGNVSCVRKLLPSETEKFRGAP
jgi:hypothetical protein